MPIFVWPRIAVLMPMTEPLESSSLSFQNGAILLTLRGEDSALYGEAVERRHKMLADALQLKIAVRTA